MVFETCKWILCTYINPHFFNIHRLGDIFRKIISHQNISDSKETSVFHVKTVWQDNRLIVSNHSVGIGCSFAPPSVIIYIQIPAFVTKTLFAVIVVNFITVNSLKIYCEIEIRYIQIKTKSISKFRNRTTKERFVSFVN